MRQLCELTNASSSSNNAEVNNKHAVSDHCKHVAIKLLRKFKNGTRGALELRDLLEDLLNSLPEETSPSSSSSTATTDPYRDIRAFAKLITSQNDMEVPLKAKPKRPASIDAAGLVNDTKRLRANRAVDSASIRQELVDVHLLYDLFNDIKQYSPARQKLSITQLLSQALSSDSSTHQGMHVQKDKTEPSVSPTSRLDAQHLRQSLECLLPPAPRGQDLRDRIDALLRHADDVLQQRHNPEDVRVFLIFLEGVTDVLAQLCAPIRDGQIRAIRNSIATAREYLSLGANSPKLNDVITSTEEKLQILVQDMQNDLHLFKIGIMVASTDEDELRNTIRKESMDRERKLVTKMYKNPLERTKQWIAHSRKQAVSTPLAISRTNVGQSLVEVLFLPQPVTVQPDSSSSLSEGHINGNMNTQPNVLPPIFHLAAKHLFLIQNRLQALTILATLNTLVPPSYTKSNMNGKLEGSNPQCWSERVWILLVSEIQDDEGNTTSSESNGSHVKIANLTDEVIGILHEAGNHGSTGNIDEPKIRSSVDRMLRLEDRVFGLLHARLKSAIMDGVAIDSEGGNTEFGVEVKSFRVPPLMREIAVTIRQMRGILDWACECWSIE